MHAILTLVAELSQAVAVASASAAVAVAMVVAAAVAVAAAATTTAVGGQASALSVGPAAHQCSRGSVALSHRHAPTAR